MKIIIHLIIILFISLTSNAQKSNSINLKYGFVFAQNRIKMNQPIKF